ncbi:MAG TPA: DegV family protein [Bacilli bacterium]|uniref:DegV family protein n=1 Tax=Amphibacillus indicireducens TaxID=1076330 RepID=A0ABP7VUZ5_9BACI|nr:DegV family protein [Bacilli bacterium]
MTVQLITDGGSDLSRQMCKDWQVKVIPLYIHLDNEQIKSDDVSVIDFAEKTSRSKSFPTTSAAGPFEYYKVFEKVPREKAIIHFSVSDGVSSAYKHAVMAKNMLLEKQPDRNIEIINTESASSGIILLMQETINKITDGLDFHQLLHFIEDRVKHLRTVFILKTLDNLIRSGRLDRIKGTVAKTLNVKLLLQASDEGKIEVLEKVRGTKKATKRFVEKIGEYLSETANQKLVITHAQAKERLDNIVTSIKDKYQFNKIITAEMGPLLSIHAGSEAIVMAFFSDEKRRA